MAVCKAEMRNEQLGMKVDEAAARRGAGIAQIINEVHPIYSLAAITAALGVAIPRSNDWEHARTVAINGRQLSHGAIIVLSLALAACSSGVDTDATTVPAATSTPQATATATTIASETPERTDVINLRACHFPVHFEREVIPGAAERTLALGFTNIVAQRGDAFINDGNRSTDWRGRPMPDVEIGQGSMYKLLYDVAEANPVLAELFLERATSEGNVFVSMSIDGDGEEQPITVYRADIYWEQTSGDNKRSLEVMFRNSQFGTSRTLINYQCDVGNDRHIFRYDPEAQTVTVKTGSIYGDTYAQHAFTADEFSAMGILPIDFRLLSEATTEAMGNIELVETDLPTYPTPVPASTPAG